MLQTQPSRHGRLIDSYISLAHIRYSVSQATRDAFNAGRAMTMMAVGVACQS